jgi:hypothetical protein
MNLHIIVQRPTTSSGPALQKTAANHPSDLPNVKTISPSAPGNLVNQKDIGEKRKKNRGIRFTAQTKDQRVSPRPTSAQLEAA